MKERVNNGEANKNKCAKEFFLLKYILLLVTKKTFLFLGQHKFCHFSYAGLMIS